MFRAARLGGIGHNGLRVESRIRFFEGEVQCQVVLQVFHGWDQTIPPRQRPERTAQHVPNAADQLAELFVNLLAFLLKR
jgi:hypothetical protein